MKKRFLAFIMAVLLMLVSLVGCGDSKTSSNDLEEFNSIIASPSLLLHDVTICGSL